MANITGTSRFLRILAERGTTGLVELVDEDLSFNGNHTIQSIGGTLTINAFTLGGAITGNSQNVTGLGTVLIAGTTTYGKLVAGKFEVNGAPNSQAWDAIVGNSWNGAAANASFQMELNRSRGTTVGSYTAVNSGDIIGQILFNGADGTDFQYSSYIRAKATGTIGGDRVPGLLEFHAFSDEASSVDTVVQQMTAQGLVVGGTTAFASTAERGVLGVMNATAPSGAIANAVQLYSVDGISGSTTIGIYQEAAIIASTVVASRTVPIVVNGSTLYMLCNTVGS